jgi:hypothetical protein
MQDFEPLIAAELETGAQQSGSKRAVDVEPDLGAKRHRDDDVLTCSSAVSPIEEVISDGDAPLVTKSSGSSGTNAAACTAVGCGAVPVTEDDLVPVPRPRTPRQAGAVEKASVGPPLKPQSQWKPRHMQIDASQLVGPLLAKLRTVQGRFKIGPVIHLICFVPDPAV